MPEIIHNMQMSGTPSQVYGELARRPSPNGAAGARREALQEGAETDFRFGEGDVVARMRVTDVEDGERISWQCVEGPADLVGTVVRIDVAASGDETVVRFRHLNWRRVTDFMAECSTRWAMHLFSMKAQLAMPEPEDVY